MKSKWDMMPKFFRRAWGMTFDPNVGGIVFQPGPRMDKKEFYIGESQSKIIVDMATGSIYIEKFDVTLTRTAILDLFDSLKQTFGRQLLKELYFNRSISDPEFKDVSDAITSTPVFYDQMMEVVRRLNHERYEQHVKASASGPDSEGV